MSFEADGELKKPYDTPSLVVYGTVARLTQNGSGSGTDGGPPPGFTKSVAPNKP